MSVKKGLSKKSVWETLERVSPLHLNTHKGNEYLVIRVLYNKVDRKYYFDVRIFELQNGKLKKTDKGVFLPIENWSQAKEILNAFERKYRNNKR